MYYNFPGDLQNSVLIFFNRFLQLLREELLWLTSSWSSASEQPTNSVGRPLSGYIPPLECFLGLGFFSGQGMFWFFGGGKRVCGFCLVEFVVFLVGFFCRELLVPLSWVILLPGRGKKIIKAVDIILLFLTPTPNWSVQLVLYRICTASASVTH